MTGVPDRDGLRRRVLTRRIARMLPPESNPDVCPDPRVFGLLADAVHWRSSRTSCQSSQHVSGAMSS